MEKYSIGFIGGGRITKIMLNAFTNKQIPFRSVLVYDTNGDVIKSLKKEFPFITIVNDFLPVFGQSIAFLALHPPVLQELLEKLKGEVKINSNVISLAPKITIDILYEKLNVINVARLIPNATSFINEGYNPVTFSHEFDNNEKISVLNLLESLGSTFEVTESKLEAYAILSAMLPTYFWFQWNKLEEIGVQMGLSTEESRDTLKNTLMAAINLLFDSGLTYQQVNDLIPVKPLGEDQQQIAEIYKTKLIGLFEKIRPQ